jgi:hypothetical protein
MSDNSVFLLHQVDTKERTEVQYGEPFRIQHQASGYWLHLNRTITKPVEGPATDLETVDKDRAALYEVILTPAPNFEDAFLPFRAESSQIDQLNTANSLMANFQTFLAKVRLFVLVRVCFFLIFLIHLLNSSVARNVPN